MTQQTSSSITRTVCIAALVALTGPVVPAAAQDAPLTLGEAVTRAVERYPSVRVAAAQVAAATASAVLAREAYLPRADVVWQLNRSTRNNVAGLLFPQPVLSPISGPVSPESGASIWNHAAGVLFVWEPFDFGYRFNE